MAKDFGAEKRYKRNMGRRAVKLCARHSAEHNVNSYRKIKVYIYIYIYRNKGRNCVE